MKHNDALSGAVSGECGRDNSKCNRNPNYHLISDVKKPGSDNLLLEISEKGEILSFSGACSAVLGYDPVEIIGKHIKTLLDQKSYQIASNLLDSLKADKPECKSLSLALKVLQKDGSKLPCKAVVYPMNPGPDRESHLVSVVYPEKGEGEISDKDHEMEDFIYMVSHEIKNPLMVIKGYIQAIDRDSNQLDSYKQRLQSQTDHLLQLVDNLLDLSLLGKTQKRITKKQVDVKLLIKRIFAVIPSKDSTVKLQFDGEIPQISGAKVFLEHLFKNIIENSIKFKDPDKKKHIIRISAIPEKEGVTYVISDNGVGVKKKIIEKIFSPGFTSDKSTGTGFGLAIAKKIVRAHNGRIWAESEGPGKGVSFYVKFPG